MLEPPFTLHGFRYVQVSGLKEKPGKGIVTGWSITPTRRPTGEFACSHAKLNQLQHNIVWGQKGNFVEVPTDCPQRDERLGWMGDAQVFVRTATFNMDVAGFFNRWMLDVVDAQLPDGSYPDVVPDILSNKKTGSWGSGRRRGAMRASSARGRSTWRMATSASWRRAMTRCAAMSTTWTARCPNGLHPDFGYGDWLAIGSQHRASS